MAEEEDEKSWLLPSEVPFDELKGHALEECLFWLLDGMGARDIAWHVGGTGAGTADGGRDIEARFYVPWRYSSFVSSASKSRKSYCGPSGGSIRRMTLWQLRGSGIGH